MKLKELEDRKILRQQEASRRKAEAVLRMSTRPPVQPVSSSAIPTPKYIELQQQFAIKQQREEEKR